MKRYLANYPKVNKTQAKEHSSKSIIRSEHGQLIIQITSTVLNLQTPHNITSEYTKPKMTQVTRKSGKAAS